MAAKAARKLSQVITHMAIGFAITYALTGSLMVGGIAVLLEPVINVLLVPFHERGWEALKHASRKSRVVLAATEKASLAAVHFAVAFSVMYAVTGSAAVGGLAAVLEPICNVILMPLHDRFWDNLRLSVRAA